MRAFKFRFYDKILKTMNYRNPLAYDFTHKEIIPQQYIGLDDCKGNEIYEGDILKDTEFDEYGNDISGYYQVVYDPKTCQFCIDNSFKKDGSHLVNIVEYFGIDNIEVVGNIFETPELLSGSEQLLTTKLEMSNLENEIWELVHNWCNEQSCEIPDFNRRVLMERILSLSQPPVICRFSSLEECENEAK